MNLTNKRFGDELSTHVTPEWRNQYLNYNQIKAVIYETLQQLKDVTEQREREHIKEQVRSLSGLLG